MSVDTIMYKENVLSEFIQVKSLIYVAFHMTRCFQINFKSAIKMKKFIFF